MTKISSTPLSMNNNVSLKKKPLTALVLNDNEVIDTVAAYVKKGRARRPL